MRRWVGAGMLWCLLVIVSMPALAASTASRGPSGCPAGLDPKAWVCFTIPEAAANDLRLQQLKDARDLAARTKPKRFGWTLGAGATVGYDPLSPVGARGALGLQLTWGFRF